MMELDLQGLSVVKLLKSWVPLMLRLLPGSSIHVFPAPLETRRTRRQMKEERAHRMRKGKQLYNRFRVFLILTPMPTGGVEREAVDPHRLSSGQHHFSEPRHIDASIV